MNRALHCTCAYNEAYTVHTKMFNLRAISLCVYIKCAFIENPFLIK